MPKKLYVGNLSFSANEGDLENFFRDNGVDVEKVELIRETGSGKSRGFGFVQLGAEQDLNAAIQATNGKELVGRRLTVNEARERTRDFRGGGRSGKDSGGRGRQRF